MFAYFNRRGTWKAVERKLAEKLAEENHVGIMISYFSNNAYLPGWFDVMTSTSPISLPFKSGDQIRMQLYPAAPYDRDPEVEKRILAVLPKERNAAKPYEFMDEHRKTWGLRQPVDTERFNGDEREYIRVANSLFSEMRLGQKGFLVSDCKDDIYQTLNYQGNEDFPEVDHLIPKSFGGSCAFANAQLVSWHFNNVAKRSKIDPEAREEVMNASRKRKLDSGIGTRGQSKKQKPDTES